MITEIYYVSDKDCILINRNSGGTSFFTLESPNGAGIYEIEILGLFQDKYEDGDASLRHSYNEYSITLTFHYSSHLMDLFRLMDADEITIPWSFGLKDDVEENFVLTNQEMIENYLHGLALDLESDQYWKGDIDLVFERVEPLKISELMELSMYNGVEVICTLSISSVTINETGLATVNIGNPGFGDLEYSLDQETWQTSNEFQLPEFGDYTFYVRDSEGCTDSEEASYNEPSEQVQIFTENGVWDWEASGSPDEVDVLVVAGGGGGGSRSGGGGGGAGEVVYEESFSVNSDVGIVIGSGGAGALDSSLGQGGDGNNTTFGSLTAIGGGGGGAARSANNADTNGRNGGSGGGGGRQDPSPSSGGSSIASDGVGNNGGDTLSGSESSGAGGGGAGSVGQSPATNNDKGSGGSGFSSDISGVSVEYGIGGQGSLSNKEDAGGMGGGNPEVISDQHGTNGGTPGSGGGGGGSIPTDQFGSGGDGANGIVIIRWLQ